MSRHGDGEADYLHPVSTLLRDILEVPLPARSYHPRPPCLRDQAVPLSIRGVYVVIRTEAASPSAREDTRSFVSSCPFPCLTFQAMNETDAVSKQRGTPAHTPPTETRSPHSQSGPPFNPICTTTTRRPVHMRSVGDGCSNRLSD